MTTSFQKEVEHKKLQEEFLKTATHENTHLKGQLQRCETTYNETEIHIKDLEHTISFLNHNITTLKGELENATSFQEVKKLRSLSAITLLKDKTI